MKTAAIKDKISTVMIASTQPPVLCAIRHLRTKGIRAVIREPGPYRYVVRVAPKDATRARKLLSKHSCR